MASRLHRALETYSIPKNLDLGEVKKLSPIFRDATELTAHHNLSEKIREAVRHSKFLIVLCSPAAKLSHWVNEEIRLFRQLHGEASILCVLAEGTPVTSFPPALTEGGREPLAANLGEGKDSFKLGTTQLAASMLGVGLDTLIQREGKRRRRRLQLITASALAFSGVMGVTAFTAVEARNEAQESRNQAEGLVEYMISDLKDRLEPLGKLEILESVGDEAVKYYNTQDLKKLSDESLMRQARSLHIIAQVAINAKNMEKAEREIGAAYALTQDVLGRNPDDATSIFAHAQSEFWAGEINFRQEKYEEVKPFWSRYNELAQKLYTKNPNNIDWIMESGWGQNNLGAIALKLKEPKQALKYYKQAVVYFDQILEKQPNNNGVIKEKSNALLGAAWAADNLGAKSKAKEYSSRNIELYESLLRRTPNDFNLKFNLIEAKDDAKRIDPSYNYSPINDLSELINHDPENMVWLEFYKNVLAQEEQ